MDDLTRASIDELRHEIDKISLAIYGDRKEPPNGGGVYGQLRSIRHEMEASGVRRDTEIDLLHKQIDGLSRQVYPRWWGYVIVAGGFALVVMFLMVTSLYLAH